MTSTTTGVFPIVQIDDASVANGKPGSLTLDLNARYGVFSATGKVVE